MKQYILEPILQNWRIRKIWPHLIWGGTMVDIGCDDPPVLIDMVKGRMKKCIGLDIAVKPWRKGKVEIKQMNLVKKIELPDNSTDVVTMLAVLEHLKHPQEITAELCRITRPQGVVLVTVPSAYSQPILELLAKLKLVRPHMIEQHENYFTPKRLRQMFRAAGFQRVKVNYFEMGLNIFVKAIK